jgi:N-dimethylarginine dimethylaminohydrolase
MSMDFGSFNMWGPLRTVAIRHPEQAFVNTSKIDAEWQKLNFHSKPDMANALNEYAVVESLLKATGANVIHLPSANELTLDSLYTHDALIVTPKGLVRPMMGKAARRAEPAVNGAYLAGLGFPIIGDVIGTGLIEGGDLVWIDRHTLLAGIGYRTNQEGVRQLQALCGPDVNVMWFDMPHYKGKSDVFHLMSFLSPIDKDLAVVYLPLMPARLVQFLESIGMDFIHVQDEEFPTMGCNVLGLGPRHVMMVEGNPITEQRMRDCGVKVEVIKGYDICRKGEGGPTCMTRPLVRG